MRSARASDRRTLRGGASSAGGRICDIGDLDLVARNRRR